MKFQPHQRVRWMSKLSTHWFRGTIVRPLLKDCYLIDDGLGLTPRVVRGCYLWLIDTKGLYTESERIA